MEELLEPADVARDEALQRCRASLGRRSLLLGVGLRLQPADRAPDLAACFGWWGAVRDAARGRNPARALDLADEELARVLEVGPTTPAGIALAATVRRHALPGLLLRGQLQALRRDVTERAFATRKEYLAHLGRLVHPVGRILLRVHGLATERNDVLSDALCTAVALSARLVAAKEDWRGGRLDFPVDEMVEHGVELSELDGDRASPELRALVALQVLRARELFAKGWPLVHELGRVGGRELAFALRWHAAGLGALEARGHDVLRGRPRAGFLRFLACATVSAATPRSPFPA